LPSEGDCETVANILERNKRPYHILMIINVPQGQVGASVLVYRFNASFSDPRKYETGQIQVIEASELPYDHAKAADELLDLVSVLGMDHPALLNAPEDSTLEGEPVPTPHIKSTESTNVIMLS
jgi:hypothetical protein